MTLSYMNLVYMKGTSIYLHEYGHIGQMDQILSLELAAGREIDRRRYCGSRQCWYWLCVGSDNCKVGNT